MLTFLSAVAFLAVVVLAIVIGSLAVAAIRSRKR